MIAARKLSSAMSAAKATADHMRDWFAGTSGVSINYLYPQLFLLPTMSKKIGLCLLASLGEPQ